MTTSTSTASDFIKGNLEAFTHNPSLICSAVVEMLEQSTTIDVVDSTSPFTSLIDSMSVLGSGILARTEVLTRRVYPRSAQTWEELYPHMSDPDFVDIFAIPDSADFIFIFSKDELLARMTPVGDTGIRKLVIPRNTKIKALDTVFSLEYPIEIRQMNHGGIQVVWDGSKTTPLNNLTTNRIEWYSQIDPSTQTELLIFKITARQFDIKTASETVNSAQQPTISIDFPDQFYYTRVWYQNSAQEWIELPIVFSDATYSMTTPTAVVSVYGNNCVVTIPQYYINTNMIRPSTKLRADVYYTKADLGLSLANYDRGQYTIEWTAIDPKDMTEYSSALKALNTVDVFSRETTIGGRAALSFNAVRERVVSNAVGSPKLPITPTQIEYALDSKGYTLVRNVNTPTKRIYLATRRMPNPKNDELITAANAGIHSLNVSVEELVGIDTVVDNDKYITIKPDTIYRMSNSAIGLLSNAERNYLSSMSRDQLAQEITQGYYYYTPFHYVIDTTEDALRCRAYYLQKPSISSRSFIGENDTTLLQVGIKNAEVSVTNSGFKLRVSTFSSAEYKKLLDTEVFAQIAFAPDFSGDKAYSNGIYAGLDSDGDRVFEFDLSSNYLLDANDKMELTQFRMYDQTPQLHRALLEDKFSILFGTTAVMPTGYNPNDVDSALGFHILPPGVAGIMHEQLTVKFGDALTNLWTSARSIVSGNEYDTWGADVPRRYEEDVYEKDPVTGSTIKIVNGEVVQTKIASRGDIVKDAQGNVVYQYMKGDIKRDADGNPLIIRTRKTRRLLDLFLMEAAYYFGDSAPTIQYREEMATTIVSWITRDLKDMIGRALENTQVLFYPTQTTGLVEVLYGPSLTTMLESAQSFVVKVYVNNQQYKNEKIREQIIRKTIQSYQETLRNATVSTSLISDGLKNSYGDDVISFEGTRIGGDKNLSLVTLLDSSKNLSLKKRLTLRADDMLAVEEDVTVEFYRHATNL